VKPAFRKSRRHQAGFTMVELLITLVVTMFGLMGLVAMNTTFSHGGQSMNQSQEAVAIGKRVLEDLRSKRTADLSTDLTGSPISSPPIDRPSYSSLAGRNGITYTVDVTVASVTATLWRMRVMVRWTDDTDGRTRALPLELLRPSTEAL
jgi:prepilin-type N-terminal cleavage/methylation domain-containing protein